MTRKIIGLYNQVRGVVEFGIDRIELQTLQATDFYEGDANKIVSVVSIEDGADDDVESSTNDVFCVILIRIDACIELSKSIYAPIYEMGK